MNSFNHYAYGAIGDWLYSKVAGIDVDPSRPGYKRIVVEPHPGGKLTHARASLDSISGTIVSGWRRDGSSVVYSVTIPANTTAVVRLPAAAIAHVKESGKALDKAEGCTVKGSKNGRVEIAVGAGSYTFEVKQAGKAATTKGATGAKSAGAFDPPT
jgi:alpha-L-rhamnosidase